jgi:hypothetical protein
VLAILIPTVWLTLAAFFVLLCRMAARGDKDIAAASAPMARVTSSRRGTLVIAPAAHHHTPARTRRPGTAPRLLARERTAHSGRQRP